MSSGRQRLVRVLCTLPWASRSGGAEEIFQGLLEGSRESGYELEVVFFEDGPWARELRESGAAVHVLPAGRLRHPHRFIATVWRLARIARRSQPDLILNWGAKPQLYGAAAALVCGMRERVFWWQQGVPRRHWIDRCATALPALAVGCYSRDAASAQQRIRPSRPTPVVHPGAHRAAARQAAAPLEFPDELPLVGLVGRLQPWKGQDRMLRAAALLRERGREFHLVLVGGDSFGLSPDYARSLPLLAHELGVADMVSMTGEVPDAGPYVEQMDVLVNASEPEPFGMVLLEAMARGVAVVAVDAGGPSEIVEQGISGVLAPSGEPAALADAIESLLEQPDRRRAIAAAGRDRFLAAFTTEMMCARMAALFGELYGRRAGA